MKKCGFSVLITVGFIFASFTHTHLVVQNPRVKADVSLLAGQAAQVEVLKKNGSVAFTLSGIVLDTNGNKLSIASDDLAVAVETSEAFSDSRRGKKLSKLLQCKPGSAFVICQSGKLFSNVNKAESATTGTPGFISKPREYIGMCLTKESISGMAGSGKRMDYFKNIDEQQSTTSAATVAVAPTTETVVPVQPLSGSVPLKVTTVMAPVA